MCTFLFSYLSQCCSDVFDGSNIYKHENAHYPPILSTMVAIMIAKKNGVESIMSVVIGQQI
jgi:hypothetical protein